MGATTRDLPRGNLRFAWPIGAVLGNNMMQIMQTSGRDAGTTIRKIKCNRLTFHSYPAARVASICAEIATLEKQSACVPEGHGLWVARHETSRPNDIKLGHRVRPRVSRVVYG